jgi:hypothetical protein
MRNHRALSLFEFIEADKLMHAQEVFISTTGRPMPIGTVPFYASYSPATLTKMDFIFTFHHTKVRTRRGGKRFVSRFTDGISYTIKFSLTAKPRLRRP